MDMEKYKQFLLSVLPVAKSVSGGREINCRCMYCTDYKNPRKGHFYISIPQSEDEPSKFNCFKCSSSGWVTTQKLVEWGIYDPDIAVELNEHNKKVMKSPNYKSIKYNSIYPSSLTWTKNLIPLYLFSFLFRYCTGIISLICGTSGILFTSIIILFNLLEASEISL